MPASAICTSTATRSARWWACSRSAAEGLSGTGPKAGGPSYLTRFATERVRTTDITATGGNVGLLGFEQIARGVAAQAVHVPGALHGVRRHRPCAGYDLLTSSKPATTSASAAP